MSKTDLVALNLHLFEALERLNDDEEMHGEKGDMNIERAKAITNIAKTIVSSANVTLNAKKHMDLMGYEGKDMPDVLKIEHADE